MTDRTKSKLIINHPELQSHSKRWFFSAITLIAWGIWFYLWLPLVSLLAWAFGVQLFVEYMLVDENGAYITSLGWYGVIIAGSVAVMLAWSHYNWKRFGRMDRRQRRPNLKTAQIADHFRLPERSVELARNSRRLVVELSEAGEIAEIHAGALPSPVTVEATEPPPGA